MNTPRASLRLPASLAAAAITLWLAGCDSEPPTAAERPEDTARAAEAQSRAAMAASTARIKQMVDQLAKQIDDATITASINAELARDPALGALQIAVETEAGHVRLRGSAPDRQARNRAASLAAGVKGVAGIDNQLKIRNG